MVGMKVIPIGWLVLPAVAAYVKAITSAARVVQGEDFRNLNSDEFMEAEKGIKTIFVGLLVLAGLSFGLGRLVAWIF